MPLLPRISPWGRRPNANGTNGSEEISKPANGAIGSDQKLVINKLDNIKCVLNSIKLDTGAIAKALQKPTSAEKSKEGLTERKPKGEKPGADKKDCTKIEKKT